MMDKYSGGIVGHHTSHKEGGVSYETATETSSVEELLVVPDGFVEAALSQDGEVVWQKAGDVLPMAVAKNQMTSMLRDHHRNNQYRKAIHACIAEFKSKYGRAPGVLDIGSGTGLLSLFAAEAGAREVHAYEQWSKMAEISRDVIKENKFDDCIHVHNQHSSDSAIGVDGITKKLDVVFSEILDSALLGEGLLPSLHHAYKELLETPKESSPSSPMCVPQSARLIGVLVHSPFSSELHHIAKMKFSSSCTNGSNESMSDSTTSVTDISLSRYENCSATPVAIPVHSNFVKNMVKLTEPFEIPVSMTKEGVEEWYAAPGAEDPESSIVRCTVNVLPNLSSDLTVNAVLFWWEVVLFDSSSSGGERVVYSTDPSCIEKQNWQDHWVQCLQALPEPLPLGALLRASQAVPVVSTPSPDTPHLQLSVICRRSPMSVQFFAGPLHTQIWRSRREYNLALKRECPSVKRYSLERSAIKQVDLNAVDTVATWPLTPLSASTMNKDLLHAPFFPVFLEPQPCLCGLHSIYTPDRRRLLGHRAYQEAVSTALAALLNELIASRSSEMWEELSGLGLEDVDSQLTLRTVDCMDGSVWALALLSSPALRGKKVKIEVIGLEKHSTLSTHTEQLWMDYTSRPDFKSDGFENVERGLVLIPSTAGEVSPLGLAATVSTYFGDAVEDRSESCSVLSENHELMMIPESTTEQEPEESESIPPATIMEESDDLPEDAGDGMCGDLGSTHRSFSGNAERLMEEYADENDEANSDVSSVYSGLENLQALTPLQFDACVSEPFLTQTQNQPLWTAMALWLRRSSLLASGSLRTESLRDGLGARVLPHSATVRFAPVRFAQLHRNHGVVHSVCEFKHSDYAEATKDWAKYTYQFPCWQYAYAFTAASQPLQTLQLSRALLTSPDSSAEFVRGGVTFTELEAHCLLQVKGEEGETERVLRAHTPLGVAGAGVPNAIMVWVDFHLRAPPAGISIEDAFYEEGNLRPGLSISTGPPSHFNAPKGVLGSIREKGLWANPLAEFYRQSVLFIDPDRVKGDNFSLKVSLLPVIGKNTLELAVSYE